MWIDGLRRGDQHVTCQNAIVRHYGRLEQEQGGSERGLVRNGLKVDQVMRLVNCEM